MAWCSNCLAEHEGPCLDELRRNDVRGALGGFLGNRVTVCPTCGVELPFCPVCSNVPASPNPPKCSCLDARPAGRSMPH